MGSPADDIIRAGQVGTYGPDVEPRTAWEHARPDDVLRAPLDPATFRIARPPLSASTLAVVVLLALLAGCCLGAGLAWLLT